MARVKIGNVFPSDQYLLERCAPTGYGLGSDSVLLTSKDDLNKIKANGWYYWNYNDKPANVPITASTSYLQAMRVWTTAGSTACQELVDISGSTYQGCKMQRTMYGSDVYDWEWVNPPMLAGYEYRTTERYMGKPVYIKLVDCDGMPSPNSTKEVEHGIQPISHIVDFGGEMMPSYANPISLPFRFSSDNYAYLSVDVHRVVLESGATDLAAYTDVHVWIKYTKTTD